MDNQQSTHDFTADFAWIRQNEKKTKLVLILTLGTMAAEVFFGYFTHSMALLADGWHMGSHAGAFLITFLAYRSTRSERLRSQFSFGTGKFIPLGGFTNAVILGVVAILLAWESVHRLFQPEVIDYQQAIIVTILGLVINLVCAYIIRPGSTEGHHHHHAGHDHHSTHHHDHNLRSTYFHIIADALTSLLAIIGLTAGWFLNIVWADASVGIIGSAIVMRWSYQLCKESGWELLDGHSRVVSRSEVEKILEAENIKVLDLHLWSIGPQIQAAELVIEFGTEKRMPIQSLKKHLKTKLPIHHLVVEVIDS
jgi:cation diffusion facilitator family transporter